MLNLIEDDDFLKDEHKYFIDNIILSSQHFPYYLNTSAVGDDGNKFLSHTILRRPEERANDEQIFRSPYADHAIEIFKTFIIKHKIDTEELLRCAVNLCFKTKSKDCTIHTDHEYDHKQLIIYLNDPIDKTAKTILLDPSKKKILHKLTPKQYKGVCFDSCPHYFNFPKKDIRVVLVYTFR
tara:strand:- start:754 stop:1296 length:543 start_codon:yes stop_codon:yes gene_type:complete